jgi:hypothetical protein
MVTDLFSLPRFDRSNLNSVDAWELAPVVAEIYWLAALEKGMDIVRTVFSTLMVTDRLRFDIAEHIVNVTGNVIPAHRGYSAGQRLYS